MSYVIFYHYSAHSATLGIAETKYFLKNLSQNGTAMVGEGARVESFMTRFNSCAITFYAALTSTIDVRAGTEEEEITFSQKQNIFVEVLRKTHTHTCTSKLLECS